ncbi:helix-turn-helix domain-containing protein [Allohahella marinimesophila]|uniref:Helix-turn-helix domain-containing protein n=1 Tax=Allohahella marinimesophila TaxID=1054972 RepID=A0ABP7NQ67_9GAMM
MTQVQSRYSAEYCSLEHPDFHTSCFRGDAILESPLEYSGERSGYFEFWTVLFGQLNFSYGDQAWALSAGDLLCFSAVHPHGVMAASQDCRLLRMRVPLAELVQSLPMGELTRLLQEATPFQTVLDSRMPLSRVLDWVGDLQNAHSELTALVLDEALLYLRRRMLEVSRSTTAVSPIPMVSQRGLQQTARMVEFIAENFRSDINIVDIADAAGLPKSTAMAVFKATLGSSILSFLTDMRLRHAKAQLVSSTMQVAGIAYDSGFSSLTRFYEVFARHTSMTPLQYRRASYG